MPVYGPTKFGLSTNGALSGASGAMDYPLESDVRYGVVYDNGSQTGTYLVVIPTPIVATSISDITHDFYVDQYANFSASILINDTYNSPINLESYTIQSSIKENEEASTIESFSIVKTDAANGQIEMSLTSEQTAQLTGKVYYYDLVITDDETDNSIRALYGHVRVSSGVTR